jgi:TatD DNase family protein
VIDFHCHLDLYHNPVEAANECIARDLYVLSVTTAPSAWRVSRQLLERSGRIRVALGLHPQIAHERRGEIDLFQELIGESRYVGEIGLDGGPEYREHWNVQNEVFVRALDTTAKAGGRILSIHSRHAATAVLDVLSKNRDAGLPVLHWFSGTPNELKLAIDLGCWFSVGPSMLSSERGQSLVAQMPRERILTETDGPFTKHQGTPLFPWDAQRAVKALALLWQAQEREVEVQLMENLREIVALGTQHLD